jgi:hypothetical protein
MTTRGVRTYVEGLQRKLGLAAKAAQLTKLQTGGPDGDLGSNESACRPPRNPGLWARRSEPLARVPFVMRHISTLTTYCLPLCPAPRVLQSSWPTSAPWASWTARASRLTRRA